MAPERFTSRCGAGATLASGAVVGDVELPLLPVPAAVTARPASTLTEP